MKRLTIAISAVMLFATVPPEALAGFGDGECDTSHCETVYDDCFANNMDLPLDLAIGAHCLLMGIIFGPVGGGVCMVIGVVVSHNFDEGTDEFCFDKEQECYDEAEMACEDDDSFFGGNCRD